MIRGKSICFNKAFKNQGGTWGFKY